MINKFAKECINKISIELCKPEIKNQIENQIIKPLLDECRNKLYPYISLILIMYIINILLIIIILILIILYNKKNV